MSDISWKFRPAKRVSLTATWKTYVRNLFRVYKFSEVSMNLLIRICFPSVMFTFCHTRLFVASALQRGSGPRRNDSGPMAP